VSIDRAELAGTGAALAFHVALVAALSLSLASVDSVPEPPSMEVELVEDVALTAATATPLVAPPPPSQAPEIGEAEPVEPPPVPRIEPTPPPKIEPAPPPPKPSRAAPAKPAPAKPAPAKAAPAKAAPAKPTPAKAAPKVSRIGDDFLKGISEAPAKAAPAQPAAAATVSASAMAGIVQAIRRQVQPCADRQVSPGPGANRIRVKMRLQLSRGGRLSRPPQVLGTSGVDEENGRYEERVKDLAVATFVGCAPLTGLPPDLYETASGKGWSDFIMNYNLP
jgi:outer membrane biosynthesis protein TonB